jgi:outer membrane protein OmpA-like peptidoglycan-associated protein
VVVVKPEHVEEFKKIKAELPKIDLKITFHYNSVQPTPEGEQQLHQLGVALQKMPDGKFNLVGHTDARGSDDYNMTLSQRRAAAVVAILVTKYNIPIVQLIPSGQGERELLAGLPPDHEANRRVEVVNLGL